MTKPLLTILIPAIPERLEKLQSLIKELDSQVERCIAEHEVEIICLLDNKHAPIGTKRQRLLYMASGEYITFIDDDDQIASSYLERIMQEVKKQEYDLITIPVEACIENEAGQLQRYHVVSSVECENEPLNPEGITFRKPVHSSAVWLKRLAVQSAFPSIMWGEDFKWAEPLWSLVKNEKIIIGKPLYFYIKEKS